LIGVNFPGTDPKIELWFADVASCSLRPRFSGERVPGGFVMVLPLGPEANRVVVYERGATRHSEGPPSFDQIAAAWNRLTHEDISGGKPLWTSYTTDSSRQAQSYRQGRVLLAGDAAHIHLPIGAQGMSAGIGDAMNLGWKLAAEINGHAPAGLLDTYHAERHPVAARILINTLAQRILYLSGEEMDPMREVLTRLLAYEEARQLLVGMVTGLDIQYDVGADGHPLLGRRLPNVELTGDFGPSGKASARQFLHAGRGVVLDLVGDEDVRATAAPWADRVDVVTTTSQPEREFAHIDAALVRPDGYIGWIGSSGGDGEVGGASLPDALARWFGQPLEHRGAVKQVAGGAER
jgi:bifunctional hydroxylase/dehydrase